MLFNIRKAILVLVLSLIPTIVDADCPTAVNIAKFSFFAKPTLVISYYMNQGYTSVLEFCQNEFDGFKPDEDDYDSDEDIIHDENYLIMLAICFDTHDYPSGHRVKNIPDQGDASPRVNEIFTTGKSVIFAFNDPIDKANFKFRDDADDFEALIETVGSGSDEVKSDIASGAFVIKWGYDAKRFNTNYFNAFSSTDIEQFERHTDAGITAEIKLIKELKDALEDDLQVLSIDYCVTEELLDLFDNKAIIMEYGGVELLKNMLSTSYAYYFKYNLKERVVIYEMVGRLVAFLETKGYKFCDLKAQNLVIYPTKDTSHPISIKLIDLESIIPLKKTCKIVTGNYTPNEVSKLWFQAKNSTRFVYKQLLELEDTEVIVKLIEAIATVVHDGKNAKFFGKSIKKYTLGAYAIYVKKDDLTEQETIAKTAFKEDRWAVHIKRNIGGIRSLINQAGTLEYNRLSELEHTYTNSDAYSYGVIMFHAEIVNLVLHHSAGLTSSTNKYCKKLIRLFNKKKTYEFDLYDNVEADLSTNQTTKQKNFYQAALKCFEYAGLDDEGLLVKYLVDSVIVDSSSRENSEDLFQAIKAFYNKVFSRRRLV